MTKIKSVNESPSEYQQFLLVFLTFIQVLFCQNTGSINGYVIDKQTGEPLVYANIIEENTGKGTTTNSGGYFYLQLPPGPSMITFTYIGYETFQEKIQIEPGKLTTLTIKMEPASIEFTSVEVWADKKTDITTSLITLDPRRIDAIPVVGEGDLTRVMTSLPGITFENELSSKINIRGGDPDQTLFLIDGAPVFFPSHLFGAFSMFNTEAIKNVRIIKGNPPLIFFGRNGSVVDIINKDGNREKITGSIRLGLISNQFNLEGPLGKGSFFMAGRRTYYDYVIALLNKIGLNAAGVPDYYFRDLQLKITQQVTEKDKVMISVFTGSDYLDNFSPDLQFDKSLDSVEDLMYSTWKNVMFTGKWEHLISPAWYSTIQVYDTRYTTKINATNTLLMYITPGIPGDDYYYYSNFLRDAGVKAVLQYMGTDYHQLTVGMAVNSYNYQYNSDGIYHNKVNRLDGNQLLGNFFFRDIWEISPKLLLQGGLRVNITNKENQSGIDARLAFHYRLTKNLLLKGGWGQYTQYLHMVNPPTLLLLRTVDLWLPVAGQVPPSKSRQWVGGAEYRAPRGKIDLEWYYNNTTNIVRLKIPPNKYQRMNEFLYLGDGYSYGFEALATTTFSRATAQIGYTLSVAKRRYPGFNNGYYFRARFNRLHEFNFTTEYRLNSNWKLNMNWIFATGQPYTAYTGIFGLDNRLNPQSSKLLMFQLSRENEFTLPPYHRLDISFVRNYVFKRWKMDLEITIFNAYNHRNVISMESSLWLMINRKTESIYSKLMPIFPSISVKAYF